MTMTWFRSHHGTPSATILSIIAKNSQQPRAFVTAIYWELYDYASRNNPRGNIEGIDLEIIAFQQDIECHAVSHIVTHMYAKSLIDTKHNLSAWSKEQVHKEDDGAVERKRQQRARNVIIKKQQVTKKVSQNVTPCHAMSQNVTIDTDTDTDTDNYYSNSIYSANDTPPEHVKTNTTNDLFEQFWELYPKKVNKKSARQKFSSVLKLKHVDFNKIMDGLKKYVGCKRVISGYVLHPTTWLNGENWNDDYEQEAQIDGRQDDANSSGKYTIRSNIRGSEQDSDNQLLRTKSKWDIEAERIIAELGD